MYNHSFLSAPTESGPCSILFLFVQFIVSHAFVQLDFPERWQYISEFRLLIIVLAHG